MKTLKQIQDELPFGTAYTMKKFATLVKDGCFIEYDGTGFYHDGENRVDVRVNLAEVKRKASKLRPNWQYPYVVWYNR